MKNILFKLWKKYYGWHFHFVTQLHNNRDVFSCQKCFTVPTQNRAIEGSIYSWPSYLFHGMPQFVSVSKPLIFSVTMILHYI